MNDVSKTPSRVVRALPVLVLAALFATGCTAVSAPAVPVGEALKNCQDAAARGKRGHSDAAAQMSAICAQMAAKAGIAAQGSEIARLAAQCRNEARRGHGAALTSHDRLERRIAINKARESCEQLQDAARAGTSGG